MSVSGNFVSNPKPRIFLNTRSLFKLQEERCPSMRNGCLILFESIYIVNGMPSDEHG